MHALDQVWETIRREFDAACAQAARAGRYQLTNELNQLLRRLRHYENESEWVSALLDGAGRFAHHLAVFSVEADSFQLRGQNNLELPEHLSFPLSSAAAFASAADTRDPVIALRTASEVTEHLASPDASERCHLFPIMNGKRVVAILFAADQEYMDVNALELIAGLGSAVLERQSNVALHSHIEMLPAPEPTTLEPEPVIVEEPPKSAEEPVQVAETPEPAPQPEEAPTPEPEPEPVASSIESPAASDETPAPAPEAPPPTPETPAPAKEKPSLPAWADLSEEQRALHIRAQRFSRVAVAEMQLAKPQSCRAGREQNNLYLFLKPEIDKARETYRKQFMTTPSMVDYLHLELVHSAAEGDEMKLGEEYPGQLV